MCRISLLLIAALAAVPLAACDDTTTAGNDSPALQYGEAVSVGNGQARSYVLLDEKNGGAPLEIGVALTEQALDGLPAPDPDHAGGHPAMYSYLLPLPARMPSPFRLVELNWNPAGHEPPGVYDKPHFDFHFYTVSLDERNAIVPSDPDYTTRAANFPQGDFVPAGYMVLPPPPAPAPAVPMMGVHWVNLSAPEIQPPGSPDHGSFTRTFIYGSWDGRFTFVEPMVTLELLLSRPDDRVPIATPAEYAAAGYHPAAYRVYYDDGAKEYRVALTELTQR